MDSTDLGAQVRTNLIVSDIDFELPMRCTEGDTKRKLMKGLSLPSFSCLSQYLFLVGCINSLTSSEPCRRFGDSQV